MINIYFEKNKLNLLGFGMVLWFALCASVTSASAQTTFANFSGTTGANDVSFANNSGSDGNLVMTNAGGELVDFKYLNVVGLPAALVGTQAATMTISAPTNTVATTSGTGGSNIDQPISGLITITFTRNTPFNGTDLLLKVEIAPVTSGLPPLGPYPAYPASTSTTDITGSTGGTSASFNGSTPTQSIRFSSDYLDFTQTNLRALAFSFTSLVAGSPNTGLSLGSGNFLNSFNTYESGNFSSNPLPRYNPPTAAAVNVSGRILTADGRGIARTQVRLTDGSGATRLVTSNSFGYYIFDAVQSGQTVVVSASAKRYAFAAQVVTVSGDLTELNFIAQ